MAGALGLGVAEVTVAFVLAWRVVDGIDAAGYIVPLSVVLVVGGSCVLATFVPALRASQVDPVVTLKTNDRDVTMLKQRAAER